VKEGEQVAIGALLGEIKEGALPEKKPEVKKEEKPKEEKVQPSRIKEKVLEEREPVKKEEAAPKVSDQEMRKRMSPLRQTIATRLVEVLKQAAMLTTFNEVDMSAIKAIREKHQEKFQSQHGIKLGLMSFFVKAVVEGLKAYPELNAYIDGEEIVYRHYYHIGIAVSAEKGLFVPVVRDCDVASFAEIEKEIARLAKKAREGKIAIDDLTGAGFTITNGGVFGSLLSTPILNPPQVGILGMHKIQERAVVVEGQIVIRPMMYLALSYDHRIVDGKEAISFLARVKEALEDPLGLLLFTL
jgi:2-oxoglutarate dehydrogenase E2 component (dihydrolipoamide succinyltransferase)